MHKPRVVQVFTILTVFRLAFSVLAMGTVIILSNLATETNSPIIRGFLKGATGSEFGLANANQIGYYLGSNVFPIALVCICLYFLIERKYTGLIVVLSISAFIGLTNVFGFLYNGIFLLLFLFNSNAKAFMKNEEIERASENIT